MKRPRLLDLYCGAGGVAQGYHEAGFEVDGVDSAPQPRYPFRFIQADALAYLWECGHCYDAIHASPPCQKFTQLAALMRSRQPDYDARHPDLIEPTRELLLATGTPYVMENVVGAPLIEPVMLCGSMFGLQTECGAQLRRHRLFETNWLLLVPMKCVHRKRIIGVYGTGMAQEGARTIGVYGDTIRGGTPPPPTIGVYSKNPEGRTIGVHGRPQLIENNRGVISVHGGHARDRGAEQREAVITITGHSSQQNVVKNQVRRTYTVEQARQAMGIGWMTQKELSQAIPPAYTAYIGRQLLAIVGEGETS